MNDLTGKRFGRWTVLKYFGRRDRSSLWRCRCSCGVERNVSANNLKKGGSKSCGCARIQTTILRCLTHGETGSRAFNVWRTMKNRCFNPKDKQFKDYGGRGITVCKRWVDFGNFLDDTGQPPLGMTLDRIDNDDGYKPSNCRWATAREQAAHKSNSVFIRFMNTTLTAYQWSELLEVRKDRIYDGLNAGKTGVQIVENIFRNGEKEKIKSRLRQKAYEKLLCQISFSEHLAGAILPDS